MFENFENEFRLYNQTQNKKKSPVVVSYLSLIILAVISALVIASPWLQLWLTESAPSYGIPAMGGSTSSYGMQGLGWVGWIMVTIVIQELLVIPATIIVIVVYRTLARRMELSKINLVTQIFIPFAFNLITANLFFLFAFVVEPSFSLYNNFFASQLSHNLTITIKNESIDIEPNTDSVFANFIYHATLHVENKSGQEISGVGFSIGDYTTQTSQADAWNHGLGHTSSPDNIHPGASDIIIDVRMIIDRRVDCGAEILAKPFYLLYDLPKGREYYGHLPIGININQRILELACSKK